MGLVGGWTEPWAPALAGRPDPNLGPPLAPHHPSFGNARNAPTLQTQLTPLSLFAPAVFLCFPHSSAPLPVRRLQTFQGLLTLALPAGWPPPRTACTAGAAGLGARHEGMFASGHIKAEGGAQLADRQALEAGEGCPEVVGLQQVCGRQMLQEVLQALHSQWFE